MRFVEQCIGMVIFAGFGIFLSCSVSAAPDSLKLILTQSLNEFMTEIRYEDREPEQPVAISRILVLGDRVRMDYGQDGEGFILFDRRANSVWHVSPSDRRLTGIASGKVAPVWPLDWKLTQDETPSETLKERGVLVQIRLNGKLCSEFKAAPILKNEARLLSDFRRMLAANQANAWRSTPEDLRQPCSLALDVHAAGVEYSRGLLLAVRYWDGRSRIYLGHEKKRARPELFELPADYTRFVIGAADQGKEDRRQPRASQAR